MGEKPVLDDALARALVEATPDALVVVDARGRIVFLNARAEDLFGAERSAFLGEPVEVLLPDALRPSHVAHREAFVAAPRARVMGRDRALRARRRDGTEVPVEITLSPVRTDRGPWIVAAVRDVTERLRGEEALRRSELQYRELVDQASDGIFVADLDGRYTHVNDAACRMLGYEPDEILGKTIVDLIPPEDVPRLVAAKELLLHPGSTQTAEWTLRRKDGVFLPVEISAKILSDGRWQAIVRDISERKANEHALRASEEALARAQRVARIGSWEWDLETDRVERSSAMFDIFGVSRDERYTAAFTLSELFHPEDRDAVVQLVRDAAREGRSYSVEHRLLLADGTERFVLQQGEPVIEGGRAVKMVGTILDITDRKRAERDREESLRRLRTVLEQCPVGIVLIDRNGKRIEANRRANALFGRVFDPADGVTQYANDLLGPDGTRLPFDELPGIRAVRGARVEAFEMLLQHADGRRIPILANAAPILGEGGALNGAVVAFEDITALKELERVRAEWSSIVAHDLRQPLNTIALYTRVVGRLCDDSRVREPLDQISRAAVRLDRMIHDLMDLSRLEARRLALSRVPLDVAATVRVAVEHAALDARDRSFEVVVRGEPPRVEADADRVAQVLENLLSNAVKYGRAGTPIVATVEGGPAEVSVSVSNEGAGIAPADLPHLFQRFQRTDDAKRGGIKGIGLGLYIVRELVEAHGGRVEAQSAPGGTTTFRFTLPVAKSAT